MLKLNTSAAASDAIWYDLVPGVRIEARPISTAVMMAARADPKVAEAGASGLPDGQVALIVAKVLAKHVISDWEGVGDVDGNPIEVTPDGIDALLEVWPIFEAFQLKYVSGGLILEQEKNV